MLYFTSSRERRLWICAGMVVAAIFSTLFIGQPLARLLSNQDVQAIIFVTGMLLVSTTIAIHAWKIKPRKFELMIGLGVAAVYLMFFLRLGLPERSHLIEYSVLAIFIHEAITERLREREQIFRPASIAFFVTFLLGVLDECLQIVIPQRVFDPADILFNGMAAAAAIGASLILNWARKRRGKSRSN